MGESDLEDSATHPFDPEEWIGKGCKLPSPNDIPQGLASKQSKLSIYERNLLKRSQLMRKWMMKGNRYI